jgi:hypothetical protein
MRGCKLLRLMSHKVTLRSYSYFLHCLHLIFGEKWFLQLCPKLPNFVEKPQGILGVKKSKWSLTNYYRPWPPKNSSNLKNKIQINRLRGINESINTSILLIIWCFFSIYKCHLIINILSRDACEINFMEIGKKE